MKECISCSAKIESGRLCLRCKLARLFGKLKWIEYAEQIEKKYGAELTIKDGEYDLQNAGWKSTFCFSGDSYVTVQFGFRLSETEAYPYWLDDADEPHYLRYIEYNEAFMANIESAAYTDYRKFAAIAYGAGWRTCPVCETLVSDYCPCSLMRVVKR